MDNRCFHRLGTPEIFTFSFVRCWNVSTKLSELTKTHLTRTLLVSPCCTLRCVVPGTATLALSRPRCRRRPSIIQSIFFYFAPLLIQHNIAIINKQADERWRMPSGSLSLENFPCEYYVKKYCFINKQYKWTGRLLIKIAQQEPPKIRFFPNHLMFVVITVFVINLDIYLLLTIIINRLCIPGHHV